MSDDLNVLGFFKAALAKVTEIDNQLDAAEGSKGAGKRAVRNQLTAQYAEEFAPVVENLEANVSKLEGEKLVAFVSLLTKALAKFDDAVDAVLTALIPETPEAATSMSDDDKKKLGETRKRLFAQLKQLITMAETMELDTSEMILPPRRNVASGPRGKQALSTYIYEVQTADGDEVELPEDAGLNEIAKKYGFEKSAALRAAFRDNAVYLDDEGGQKKGIDTSTPPAKFEFTFDNGDVLIASAPIPE